MERWPRFVYDEGEDPDVRFTMANERTFLAWIRTSLGFLAAGVAVDVVDLELGDDLQRVLAALLLLLGLLCAVTAWVRWARTERSMRRHQAIPAPLSAGAVSMGLLVIGALLLVIAVR
jgi:putative membrane protein